MGIGNHYLSEPEGLTGRETHWVGSSERALKIQTMRII